MSYQIRHKEFGVFQGECMGMGFWHPMSDMPEQGYCEWPTEREAQEYINFICGPECSDPLNHEDLTVEPYDMITSEALRRAYANRYEPDFRETLQ